MRISTKLNVLLLLGGITFSNTSFAQEEIEELIKSSPADATALTKAYLEPFFKGTGLGLNSGWTNTGTTKKLLRFDVKVGLTAAMPPASAKSFDVTKLGLSSSLRPTDPNDVIAPTIAGAKQAGPNMTLYSSSGTAVTDFDLPKGLDLPMPSFQIQANVGLIKGFEAMIRYSPEVQAGDEFGKLNMKGGGIKFQPLRLISKRVSKLVPVDVAMAVGYNSIKYSYDQIDVKPESGAAPRDPSQVKDFSNQKFEIEFSGVSVEAIASKKLLMFVPFVSVGYVTSNTKAGLYGNYPVTNGVLVSGSSATKTYETFTDPVKIDEKFVGGLRAGAGLSLNLFIFHIYSSYNIAPYKYLNAGIGIGFGK